MGLLSGLMYRVDLDDGGMDCANQPYGKRSGLSVRNDTWRRDKGGSLGGETK